MTRNFVLFSSSGFKKCLYVPLTNLFLETFESTEAFKSLMHLIRFSFHTLLQTRMLHSRLCAGHIYVIKSKTGVRKNA